MTTPAALAGESTAPVLAVTGLSKRFGTVQVLRDVTLRIGPGEVVALVGENGAGKSVLVACLARILDADSGDVRLGGRPMPATADQVRAAGLEVVWQDHGHCDDLDVVANIYLGQEPSRFLSESRMQEGARSVMNRVGADRLPLDRPMRMLSRGQRQLVAVGRALRADPRVLLLDEPTASLGVAETLRIQALIRECRSAGTGMLLVTHDLEQVFTLADRVVVLREGRIVADAAARSVSRDDVVSLMSGIGMDSTARRELHRLRSLVDQLSDVEPAASLPLIVSAMATALDQDMVCVHLLEEAGDGTPVLRRTAAVGLPRPLLEITDLLPLGVKGGGAGLAAAEGQAVVVDDLAAYPGPHDYRAAAAASEVRSEWAAPIVGARGVLGTVSGFATSVGRPEPAQLELAGLYLGYAASAIERERLLTEVSRRNRVLESLRSMLESLAGPDGVDGGLGASLRVLSRAIGADAVAVFVADPGTGAAAPYARGGPVAGDGGPRNVHPAGSAHDARLAGSPNGTTAASAGGGRSPGVAGGSRPDSDRTAGPVGRGPGIAGAAGHGRRASENAGGDASGPGTDRRAGGEGSTGGGHDADGTDPPDGGGSGPGGLRLQATNEHGDGEIDPAVVRRLRAGAARVVAHDDDRPAQLIEPDLAAVALRHPEGRAVLVAHLGGDRSPGVDTLELLDDAARSLAPALEAEVLERSRREAAALRRSQAIQRELLSSLSHELRTPLTAIQGYASTLRQHDLTWDAASTERFLGSIATEAARLERLVGDLLDSSAIESGVLRLQRDWCDLRLVVEAAIGVVERKAVGAGSSASSGPSGSGGRRVVGVELQADPQIEATWGDHDRLEQVFVNLVENAVAHGASGEPIIVRLRRGTAPGTVEVEVRDRGPGLPPELGERIFEARVRGATEAPGAGLGLPIARAIVEAHGGSLRAVPVDRGASFVVALPAEPPDTDAGSGTGTGSGASGATGTAGGPTEGSWSVFDETDERHVV